MTQLIAQTIGADLSTTALKMGVRSADGSEALVSIEMRGAKPWKGEKAFKLEKLPGMFLEAIQRLQQAGWSFAKPGALSFSVRQHDMCVMDEEGNYLIRTLSWECHAAKEQVEQLRQQGAEAVVGKIEPRFILSKLLWAFKMKPKLKKKVRHVAATGDVIAWRLTGKLEETLRLSRSDALSNALLDQQTKKLATGVIEKAGLSAEWFPKPIDSGGHVGDVQAPADKSDPWAPVCKELAGWSVYAGLGDNHAGAVGCGLADDETLVVSAGSSGTVCRRVEPTRKLVGNAVCFEYYDQRLLLMMLARCDLWYKDFLIENGWLDPDGDDEKQKKQHQKNSNAAINCNLSQVVRVKEDQYPAEFAALDRGGKVASVQFSIALELLLLVKSMLAEVVDAPTKIQRVALTGGLSKAPLFRGVLQAGLKKLLPGAPLKVSARSGDLASQTATIGALVNAAMRGDLDQLPSVAKVLCGTDDAQPLERDKAAALEKLVAPYLEG